MRAITQERGGCLSPAPSAWGDNSARGVHVASPSARAIAKKEGAARPLRTQCRGTTAHEEGTSRHPIRERSAKREGAAYPLRTQHGGTTAREEGTSCNPLRKRSAKKEAARPLAHSGGLTVAKTARPQKLLDRSAEPQPTHNPKITKIADDAQPLSSGSQRCAASTAVTTMNPTTKLQGDLTYHPLHAPYTAHRSIFIFSDDLVHNHTDTRFC